MNLTEFINEKQAEFSKLTTALEKRVFIHNMLLESNEYDLTFNESQRLISAVLDICLPFRMKDVNTIRVTLRDEFMLKLQHGKFLEKEVAWFDIDGNLHTYKDGAYPEGTLFPIDVGGRNVTWLDVVLGNNIWKN